jgi:tRNA(Arg) A34 adenosine deaminase TadA
VTEHELLTRVLAIAVEARGRGDHPFGALLAVDGEIVAEAHNRVHTDTDVTAHAEMMLVRQLEGSGRIEQLAGGTVYASCEPCPMCVGALFWAGARRVVFALSHSRLNELASPAGGEPYGFTISAHDLGSDAARPPMTFVGPRREDEAAEVHLGFWSSS